MMKLCRSKLEQMTLYNYSYVQVYTHANDVHQQGTTQRNKCMQYYFPNPGEIPSPLFTAVTCYFPVKLSQQ